MIEMFKKSQTYLIELLSGFVELFGASFNVLHRSLNGRVENFPHVKLHKLLRVCI